ncbi:outer membrane lipoprotein carrier protein LolA [Mesorhizobium sp. L2C084A000]|uniref:outer-membrane lipoprotein carrier protein LolA n=1 Tax=unclassified Mesorhizobium TaxID=325217 RepID=UPI0003D04CE8|nr:outer membrane lipoprotein carrier protein LolA [Mesorhizobium sp. L2C084A000]ESZ28781.1 membrane protein [Mesorhizobium sp. L2C084A000]
MAYRIKKLLGFLCAVIGVAAVNAGASAAPVEAKTVADHFSSVKSMSGDFVQSGPKAERKHGRFFLQRPGKIRFNYAGQSGVSVIADGKSLVVYNRRLKTSRLYALSKTPLKLLLDNKVDFSGSRVKSIREDGAQVTVKLADRSAFGNSNISMVFDRKSLDLRRWSLTDEKGLTTTVTISNVRQGVRAPEGTFVIDYAANREFNTTTK